MSISEKLKALRAQHSFKQEEVAASIGVSRPAYTNYENGRTPDVESLIRLADLYDTSLDELVGREFNPAEENVRYSSENLMMKHSWKQDLKSRKTADMLLYLQYLLNAMQNENLLKTTEDFIQKFMMYVIRNVCLSIQKKPRDVNKDSFRLMTLLNNKISHISSELEEQNVPIVFEKSGQFTIDELADTKTVKDYFSVNLNEILKQE